LTGFGSFHLFAVGKPEEEVSIGEYDVLSKIAIHDLWPEFAKLDKSWQRRRMFNWD